MARRSLSIGSHFAARVRGIVLATTILAAGLPTAPALAQRPDSVPIPAQPLFTKTDLLYAGAFALVGAAMAPIDLRVAHELRDSTAQANQFLEHSATGFRWLGNPGAVMIATGTYAVGRLAGRPELADVGLHATEAVLFAEATTDIIKSLAGRARPFQDPENPYNFKLGRGFRNGKYASFPSGHTTAAFATAAAVSTEITRIYPNSAWWVKPALYGGAGLVGLSRLYNNDHWASDVVIAAAIGSFGGWKVVRFNHTHPKNRLDRLFLSASVQPSGDGGVHLAWSLAPSF